MICLSKSISKGERMVSKGAFTIIENASNEFLLVKRKDIPFWDLPGGTVEVGEKNNHCAIREVLEETGLVIEINCLVGIYEQKKRNDIQYIFSAMVCGGELISDGPETKEIKYFPINKLPINLIPLRKKQIHDFSNGKRDCYYTVKENKILLLIEKMLNLIRW